MNQHKNNQLKNSINDPVEEFMLEFNKQLIPDEVIHYVVDTANQVKISGKMYQISPFGTFVYNPNDSLEYNKLCNEFIDIYKNYTSQIDSITYTYGNITFIDSYGKIANLKEGDLLEDKLFCELDGNFVISPSEQQSDLKSSSLKSSTDRIISSYTNTYNLTTYEAGSKTIVGGWVESAFAENSWKEKTLDSKHRVKVKMYDVNYGFYKNQGFRVEYNELRDFTITIVTIKRWRLTKKEVTLWSYWSTSKTVPEMVIGIDYFQGYTEFSIPGIGYDFQRNMQKTWSDRVGNFTINMVYNGLFQAPTEKVRGWATNLYIFSGSVGVGNFQYTDNKLLEEGFNAGISAFKDYLKSKTAGFIYSKIGDITNKPVAILTPNYVNGGNREYLLLSGIHKYTNESEAHLQLGFSSGGLKVNLNSNGGVSNISSYNPLKFNIDEAFVFGAVKHNGAWQGIRLFIK